MMKIGLLCDIRTTSSTNERGHLAILVKWLGGPINDKWRQWRSTLLQITMEYAAFFTKKEVALLIFSLKVGAFLVACWPFESIHFKRTHDAEPDVTNRSGDLLSHWVLRSPSLFWSPAVCEGQVTIHGKLFSMLCVDVSRTEPSQHDVHWYFFFWIEFRVRY